MIVETNWELGRIVGAGAHARIAANADEAKTVSPRCYNVTAASLAAVRAPHIGARLEALGSKGMLEK